MGQGVLKASFGAVSIRGCGNTAAPDFMFGRNWLTICEKTIKIENNCMKSSSKEAENVSIHQSVSIFLCAAVLISLAACQKPGDTQSSYSQAASSSSGSSESLDSSESSFVPSSSASGFQNAAPAAPALQNVSGVTKAKAAGAGIPYEPVFAGFVSEYGKDGDESTYLPTGDILLGTEKEWDAFFQKYLQYDANVNYSGIPGNSDSFDFSGNSILYHSELSAKEDVYSYAYPIDQIVLGNDHKPALQEKEDFGNGFRITANGSRYIILVSLKKADIAD